MSETSKVIDTSLFEKDAAFISHAETRSQVFEEVANKLVAQGLVKPEFLRNLNEREDNYPTGIDMTPVSTDYPNIAIPHTETEFVNSRKIIPVKLSTPISFSNMIDPDQKLEVRFLFMILNNDPEGQANMLAQIMDFINKTSHDQLIDFFNSDSERAIYDFLSNNF